MIPDAHQFAIQELQQPKRLTAVHYVILGRQYGLADWIVPNVHAITGKDPAQFSQDDLDLLKHAVDIEHVLLRVFSETVRVRFAMIMKAAPLQHIDCPTQDTCGVRSWPAIWQTVSQHLAHWSQGELTPGRVVFEKLKNRLERDLDGPGCDLRPNCGRLTVNMLESAGILWQDDAMREAGANRILELCDVNILYSTGMDGTE